MGAGSKSSGGPAKGGAEGEGAPAMRESYFRALIDHSQDLTLVLEGDGTIRYASPAFRRILGHEPQEVQGRDAFGFLHPEDLPEVARVFSEGLEEPGRVVKAEYRVRHADGRWVHVEALGRNLLHDPAVRGIVINSRDVTERHRVEEELRRSEQYFRSLIENALDIISVLAADGTILYESPSYGRILGFPPEEMLGKSAFDFIHPEDLPRVSEIFFEGIRHPGVVISSEYRLRHRDGSWHDFEAVGMNLLEDPAVRGVVVNSHDISERKRYERSLEENAQRLRDFFAVASHELYHPIAIVKGYAQALAEELSGEENPLALQTARALEKAADRLKFMGDELLDLSRLEVSPLEPKRRVIDLAELLRRAAAEMNERGFSSPCTLDLPKGRVLVSADEDKVFRVMTILLENAANHSPPGQAVEVALEEREEMLVVSVLDRGPGVPEENRRRIFDRFFQGEGVMHHSRPGLGLGLYIAREIVEAHGSRIWHEPRPGGGSSFRFTLPAPERA